LLGPEVGSDVGTAVGLNVYAVGRIGLGAGVGNLLCGQTRQEPNPMGRTVFVLSPHIFMLQHSRVGDMVGEVVGDVSPSAWDNINNWHTWQQFTGWLNASKSHRSRTGSSPIL
jgi:hypothetical protein